MIVGIARVRVVGPGLSRRWIGGNVLAAGYQRGRFPGAALDLRVDGVHQRQVSRAGWEVIVVEGLVEMIEATDKLVGTPGAAVHQDIGVLVHELNVDQGSIGENHLLLRAVPGQIQSSGHGSRPSHPFWGGTSGRAQPFNHGAHERQTPVSMTTASGVYGASGERWRIPPRITVK